MTKVAVIIDTWFPFVGGAQINVWKIAQILAKKGFELTIISRNTGEHNLPAVKNINIVKLGSFSRPDNQIARAFFALRAFIYLLNKDYDLIHAHAFSPGITARLIMVFKGKPAVFTVHGTALGTKLNGKISNALESFILTKVLYTKEVSVSRDFVNLPNINKNIAVIGNGVDIQTFNKAKITKRKFPTIITVGRLHSQKNQASLINAMKDVVTAYPNVVLMIVGDGPQKNVLKALVHKLKLSKNITFITNCSGEELIKLYKSSHLFVLPSIYEGQPISLLEAWAAKLPVLVSDTGECKFLVEKGKNGYLINSPGNPQEISAKIIKILSQHNLEKLGQNGYNLVKNKYNWEQAALKTADLYEKILTKN